MCKQRCISAIKQLLTFGESNKRETWKEREREKGEGGEGEVREKARHRKSGLLRRTAEKIE